MNLDWPTGVFPRSTGFESVPNTWGFENAETRTFVSYARPGHRWRQQVTLPELSGNERIEMQMLLIELEGAVNRVLLPDFSHQRRGAGGGTPVVAGANQTGRTLAISGCPSGITWLRRGDYFQLPSFELFRLTADANTNGSGQVTLQFYPALRASPTNGAPIEYINPRAKCRLNTGTASWTNVAEALDGHRVRSGFSLDFIQSFP